MGYRKSQEVIHNGIYAVLLRTVAGISPRSLSNRYSPASLEDENRFGCCSDHPVAQTVAMKDKDQAILTLVEVVTENHTLSSSDLSVFNQCNRLRLWQRSEISVLSTLPVEERRHAET